MISQVFLRDPEQGAVRENVDALGQIQLDILDRRGIEYKLVKSLHGIVAEVYIVNNRDEKSRREGLR